MTATEIAMRARVPAEPLTGFTTASALAAITNPTDRWQRCVQGWLLGYTSPRTRVEYARDVTGWTSWCASIGVDPILAGRDHVQAWQRTLEDRYAIATVSRRVAALASLYGYLVDEEVIARSPVRGRRPRPNADTTASTGLTEQEAAALLDAAERSSLRDSVLVGLLYLLGLRVSEALTTLVEDLGHERGHRTITVTRKGGRRERLPLPPELAAQVDALSADHVNGPVLRTVTGRPVDPVAAWRIIRRLARQARLPQAATLHPHDLRHGMITHALDAGTPLAYVQDAAGHADPRTTRRYDRARGRIDGHPGAVLASRVAVYRHPESVTETPHAATS